MKQTISNLAVVAWMVGWIVLPLSNAWGQCPNILNDDGEVDTDPSYFECTDYGANWTFYPQTDGAWNNVTVDWGDGTSDLFPVWDAFNPISHDYPDNHATYTITFTRGTCVRTATLLKSVSVNPAIVVPEDYPTGDCAPATLTFLNESTNVTPDTEFEWIFDDGSAPDVFDASNAGQLVHHHYAEFSTGCQREVTLQATNACRQAEFGMPASVTIDYINIWDKDNPIIDASALVLCWPDNTVDLRNVSEKVCLNNGNTQQRLEQWDFHGPYGPGGISEIDWRPWNDSNPITLTFPSTGVYTIDLCVENFCGVDCETISILVREPLVADLTGTEEICEGDNGTFVATALDADWVIWDFQGNGSTFPGTPGSNATSPSYNTPGTYTVAVEVGFNNQSDACTATAFHDILVKPAPTSAVALSESTGCESLTVTATESNGEGAEYLWTLPDGTQANGISSGAVLLDDVGAHPFSVMVTGSNGCVAVANAVAEVFDAPTADFLVSDVCEGASTAFHDMSLQAGSQAIESWSWAFGDAEGSIETHPEHVYASAGTYTATLEVFDGRCSGSATQTLEVFDAPSLTASTDVNEGCSPLLVNFDAITEAGLDVNWDFGDGNGALGTVATHVYAGDSDVDVTYDVVARVQSDEGCVTEEAMAVVAKPSAEAAFAVSPPECSPFTPVFTNQSQGAVSYLWTFEDGTTTDDETPTQTFTNTTGFEGTQSVTLQALADNGCHDEAQLLVLVYPEANFDLGILEEEHCAPFTFEAPIIPGSNDHVWEFGDGSATSFVPNPVHVYENTTDAPQSFTLDFSASNFYGCPGTASANLTIKPQPLADFVADVQSGCAPLVVTFTEASEQAEQLTWDHGNGLSEAGSLGTPHLHEFTTLGDDVTTHAVTLTAEATGGCMDSKTLYVEVYPEVVAQPVGILESCSPWQSNLLAAGYEEDNAHDITWTLDGSETFQGASLQQTLVGLEGQNRSIDIQLSIESAYGCAADTTIEATIYRTPVAAFDLSDMAACAGTEIQFSDLSQFADSVVMNWGDGLGNTDVLAASHVFENDAFEPAVFEVVQTAYTDEGCVAQAAFQHTAYPQVRAEFLPPSPACAPFTIALVNQSANANAGFTWDFGDGSPTSSSAQPTHLFETDADASSVYTISLHASSSYGCEDWTSHDIEVHATPVADIESIDEQGCYPLEVTFQNNSLGGDVYEWSYGTGLNSNETADTHTVTFFNASSQTVTYATVLTASTEAGCSSQDVVYIDVNPQVEANITGGMNGCSPLDIEFLNLSEGATQYAWTFGDGATSGSMHPSHTFLAQPGESNTFLVQLVAESLQGCTDTAEVSVQVFGQPEANFSLSANQMTFPQTTVDIDNESLASDDAAYFWSFGDGLNSFEAQPGSHDFETWGVYNVSLQVDNGFCSDVATSAVQILAPMPTVGFSGGGSGCAPLTVAFTNESTYAQSYRWEISDGSVRSDDEPVHVFNEPGIYDVTLYVTGYEGSELVEAQTAVVEVFPTAKAAFSLNPNHVMVPGQPVFFLNLSEDADSYTWDFGDGTTSEEAQPVHEYTVAGLYDVTLTASNEFGCRTTYVLPEAVLAEEGGMMRFPNAFTPSSTGSSGGYYDPAGYDNDVFRPLHAGVETYELMVFTKWGEMIFYSDNVSIGWDGYINGKLAPQDVYAWKATAVLSNGNRLEEVGNVTLLAR